MDRPSRTKSHYAVSLSSSQSGGPPCWASPLSFGLIGSTTKFCCVDKRSFLVLEWGILSTMAPSQGLRIQQCDYLLPSLFPWRPRPLISDITHEANTLMINTCSLTLSFLLSPSPTGEIFSSFYAEAVNLRSFDLALPSSCPPLFILILLYVSQHRTLPAIGQKKNFLSLIGFR